MVLANASSLYREHSEQAKLLLLRFQLRNFPASMCVKRPCESSNLQCLFCICLESTGRKGLIFFGLCRFMYSCSQSQRMHA